MKVSLQYGEQWMVVEVPASEVTVLEPEYVQGLPDEAAAFRAAVRNPIESRPMRDLLRPKDRLALVIPDITRPLATDRLLH